MIEYMSYNMLIKTEQDIEKNTGLLVLAQIPEFNINNRKEGRK